MLWNRRLRLECLEQRQVLNGANILPIESFVEAQGTYCVDDGSGGCLQFVPPVDNFIGWLNNPDPDSPSADPPLAVSVDYAGLASEYAEETTGEGLGTEFSGTIKERELADGRAQLDVILHTTNALTWVTDVRATGESGNPFGLDNPTVFGNRVVEVLEDGADAAFASSIFKITIINPEVGMPVPDVLQVLSDPLPGQEITRVHFQATATGTFTEAAEESLGFQSGAAGRVSVSQVGILDGKFQGALADGFPVENVRLREIGTGVLQDHSDDDAEILHPEVVDTVLAEAGRGKSKAIRLATPPNGQASNSHAASVSNMVDEPADDADAGEASAAKTAAGRDLKAEITTGV